MTVPGPRGATWAALAAPASYHEKGGERMKCKRELIGEVLGTFMLVLFGCGSVAVAVGSVLKEI